MRRIAVVGGGVSGLAAAHRVLERAAATGAGAELVLYEAGLRLGGTVATRRQEGCVVEEGPDCFLTEKPWARHLVERLGLGARLIGTDPAHRRSFVVRRGRLVPTPAGFQMLAPSRLRPLWASPLFSLAGKLRMTLEPWVPRRAAAGDESLASFVRRRLGREALERIAQPMVAGIYGADPEELSLESTFPRFLLLEREHGSVLRGLRARRGGRGHAVEGSPAEPDREAAAARAASGPRYGFFASLDGGMQMLTDALAATLPASAVFLGTPVAELRPPAAGGRWGIRNARGAEEADAVILALPAHAAARLVAGFDPALAADLESIRYGSSAVVSLAYAARAIVHPLNGAGFVVPAIEKRRLLACTFSHRKFAGRAPEGQALLRAFHDQRAEGEDDATLTARTRAELEPLLGISGPPLWTLVSRHARAVPRYRVGHRERVLALEARAATHPGLFLCGNGYRGVGLPDCVRLAEAAADAALGAT